MSCLKDERSKLASRPPSSSPLCSWFIFCSLPCTSSCRQSCLLFANSVMAGRFRAPLRMPLRFGGGSARLFSSQSCLRQEIRDAYILSASRTPTAKVWRGRP